MKLEMTIATCSLTYIIYICIYVNIYMTWNQNTGTIWRVDKMGGRGQ